jgi:hypothetical protein
MTLRRRVTRAIRPAIETLLAGLLLGVVAGVLIGQLSLSDSSQRTPIEAPQARAYMLALIRNDLDTMSQLGPTADAISQAINFQKRADALKDVQIDSLTYLGGSALGGVGIHLYVVEIEASGGLQLVPFSLTVHQGRVVRVE